MRDSLAVTPVPLASFALPRFSCLDIAAACFSLRAAAMSAIEHGVGPFYIGTLLNVAMCVSDFSPAPLPSSRHLRAIDWSRRRRRKC